MDRMTIGRVGEAMAERYIKKLGYKILEKNWRMRPDEIDLIALDGACYVFIEVKTRTSTLYGTPAEAIDMKKRRSMMRAAQGYLLRKGALEEQARYDVVEICLDEENKPVITHIRSAFDHEY